LEILEAGIDTLEFDIFSFKEITGGEELALITYYLFERHNFFELLNIEIPVFSNFIRKIQSGYLPNPYHNSTHAADVVQVHCSIIYLRNIDYKLLACKRRLHRESRFNKFGNPHHVYRSSCS